MTDEQSQSATGPSLTDLQRDRITFAKYDHEAARAEDLAQLNAGSLILLVERLRDRLGDMLDLFDEVTDTLP